MSKCKNDDCNSDPLATVARLVDLARAKGLLHLQVDGVSMTLGAEPVDAPKELPAPPEADEPAEGLRFAHTRMAPPNLRELRGLK